MGKIFEKLLVVNKIVPPDELERYKELQSQAPHRSLADILLERKVIDHAQLVWLQSAEKHSQEYARVLRKQKKDQKVLETVQKLGIMRDAEIVACVREKTDLKVQGQAAFLVDLFCQKGYLTPYLAQKFYRRSLDIQLPTGIANSEQLIVNIPKYLRDKLLSKIVIKNQLLTTAQIEECWREIQKGYPRQSLGELLVAKKLLSEKKYRILLDVLKRILPEKYPYSHAYARDTKLAKLLAKKKFLSPWRINKCLLKQLDKIKHGEYVPLRHILITEGYLTAYQFDVVLKKYGDIVSPEIPGVFLMPSDEMKRGEREDTDEVGSGLSLMVSPNYEMNWEDKGEEESLPTLEEIPEVSPENFLAGELFAPPLNLSTGSVADDNPIKTATMQETPASDLNWQAVAEELAAVPSLEEDELDLIAEEDFPEPNFLADPLEVEERPLEDIDLTLRDAAPQDVPDLTDKFSQELSTDDSAAKPTGIKKKKDKS